MKTEGWSKWDALHWWWGIDVESQSSQAAVDWQTR